MDVWWFNSDFLLLCGSVLVLALVPLWIRWLCKRQAAGFRPRRMVTDHHCERCGHEVDHLSYLEFDAYERSSFFRWRQTTYAQALCPNCVRAAMPEMIREATRGGWRYFWGPLGALLTRINARKSFHEYADRHPLPDPDRLDTPPSDHGTNNV